MQRTNAERVGSGSNIGKGRLCGVFAIRTVADNLRDALRLARRQVFGSDLRADVKRGFQGLHDGLPCEKGVD